jgi:hypothetical protein
MWNALDALKKATGEKWQAACGLSDKTFAAARVALMATDASNSTARVGSLTVAQVRTLRLETR